MGAEFAARLALAMACAVAAVPAVAQQAASPAPQTVLPPEQRPAARPFHASKIILVGDSTMQANSGWGGSFCARHVTMSVACVNMGRGGRSSYSYRAEGSWDIALGEMRATGFDHVWVLIQFGHNDMPGKPERSTELAAEFPQNLRRYVEDVRAAGAVPVLVTPLVRRQFLSGKLVNDLLPWADAIRKVAAEMGVAVVDLNAASAAQVEMMGPTAANRLAELPPSPEVAAAAMTGTTIPAATAVSPPGGRPEPVPADQATTGPSGKVNLAFDYTHVGRDGADFFAAMVTDLLARAVPETRGMLIR